MSEQKKEINGLVYRGVLISAEVGESGSFKNEDTKKMQEYIGGIKLNFQTIIKTEKTIQGVVVPQTVTQNFIIKDECKDEELIERLSYWAKKEKQTLTIQLSAPKNTTAKLVSEL